MSQRTYVYGTSQTKTTPFSGNEAARLVTFASVEAGFFRVSAPGGTLRILLGSSDSVDAQSGSDGDNVITVRYNEWPRTISKQFVGDDGVTRTATHASIDADADFEIVFEEYR